MNGLTLTISRDKKVLVMIGTGGELLVEAQDSDRRELFAKLQYALMTVADLDGTWHGVFEPGQEDPARDGELSDVLFAQPDGGTVISLAARRAAKDPNAAS